MHNELAVFAARFGVAVADAYVLPAMFEVCAEKVGMPIRALIAEATYRNQKLGEYIAEMTANVAKQNREEAGA